MADRAAALRSGLGSSMFRSLSVPTYRIYFWCGIVSNTGTWMQRTAQSWVVLQLSGGAGTALGIVAFLQFGPTLFLSIPAGAVADRFRRPRILLVTQAGLGAGSGVLALMTILDILSLPAIYAIACAVGVIWAFDIPARQTLAGELVGPDNLVNAIGLNSASFNVARLLGPPLAGLLLAGLSTWIVFAVHAVSALAIIVSLIRIDRLLRAEPPERSVPLVAAPGDRLLGGLRYLRSRPDLIIIVAMASLVATVGVNNLQVLTPIIATRVYGSDAVGFGMLGAALAIGGLAGALFASAGKGTPQWRRMVAIVLGLGVAQSAASLMPGLVSFAAVLIIIGLFFMGFVVMANTLMQLGAEPQVRGRVIAVYMMFFMGGGAVGAPALGSLADRIGALHTVGAAGLFTISIGIGCGAVLQLMHRRTARALPAATGSVREGGRPDLAESSP